MSYAPLTVHKFPSKKTGSVSNAHRKDVHIIIPT